MIITVFRTFIMYMFVVLTLRIMGKRQIGQLEASELVVTIVISDIAAMPITNIGTPMSSSIVAITILLILEVLISYFAYKNINFRTFLFGKPSMFFQNGKLNQQEMKRQRFNVADLMEVVRNSGATGLSQVNCIIMETNGNISVIMNPRNSPVTPEDLNLKTEPVHLSYVVIDNGNLIHSNMKRLGLDKIWLNNQLKAHNLKSVKDVFYLSFERNSGEIVLIPQEKNKKGKGN